MTRFFLLLTALCVAVPTVWADATPIDVTAQRLDVNQTNGTAVFSGSVVVTQGSLTLTAPKVSAEYAGSGKAGNSIRNVVASGGVTITRAGAGNVAEKAVGDNAVYSPQDGQLVLTGAVTLTRGPSELSGDKLVYNLQSGNAVVTNSKGPVKARFVTGQ